MEKTYSGQGSVTSSVGPGGPGGTGSYTIVTDADMAAADRVINYLEICGDADIQAGIGTIFGLNSKPGPDALRLGIAAAIASKP